MAAAATAKTTWNKTEIETQLEAELQSLRDDELAVDMTREADQRLREIREKEIEIEGIVHRMGSDRMELDQVYDGTQVPTFVRRPGTPQPHHTRPYI